MPKASNFLTYSGQEIDLQNPAAELISITDIAHALGNLCRYNGQCTRFFSVAEHSINCALYIRSQALGQRLELLALLHDAAEAYTGDLARPLRSLIPEFDRIENNIMAAIYEALGVHPPSKWEAEQVGIADKIMLSAEIAIMLPGGQKYATEPSSDLKFKFYEPGRARLQFMSTLADVDFSLWHSATEKALPGRDQRAFGPGVG